MWGTMDVTAPSDVTVQHTLLQWMRRRIAKTHTLLYWEVLHLSSDLKACRALEYCRSVLLMYHLFGSRLQLQLSLAGPVIFVRLPCSPGLGRHRCRQSWHSLQH